MGKGSQGTPMQKDQRKCGCGVASCTSHLSCSTGIPFWELCPHVCQVTKDTLCLSLIPFVLSVLSSAPVFLPTGGLRNITIIVEDPIAGLGASSPPPLPLFLCDHLAWFRTSFSNLVSNQVWLVWSCCGAWTCVK